MPLTKKLLISRFDCTDNLFFCTMVNNSPFLTNCLSRSEVAAMFWRGRVHPESFCWRLLRWRCLGLLGILPVRSGMWIFHLVRRWQTVCCFCKLRCFLYWHLLKLPHRSKYLWSVWCGHITLLTCAAGICRPIDPPTLSQDPLPYLCNKKARKINIKH